MPGFRASCLLFHDEECLARLPYYFVTKQANDRAACIPCRFEFEEFVDGPEDAPQYAKGKLRRFSHGFPRLNTDSLTLRRSSLWASGVIRPLYSSSHSSRTPQVNRGAAGSFDLVV
jgi:hypothetical protein